jgi:hypothetical protein
MPRCGRECQFVTPSGAWVHVHAFSPCLPLDLLLLFGVAGPSELPASEPRAGDEKRSESPDLCHECLVNVQETRRCALGSKRPGSTATGRAQSKAGAQVYSIPVGGDLSRRKLYHRALMKHYGGLTCRLQTRQSTKMLLSDLFGLDSRSCNDEDDATTCSELVCARER